MIAGTINKKHCEYCDLLIEKYSNGIKTKIDETCQTSDWIYSWLFIDLQEWDVTNRYKHGIHSRSQKEIWPPLDDRILKIREKLAFLQTQMPIWVFLEFLSERVRLISSDFDEYLTSEELSDTEKDLFFELSNEEFVVEQQEKEDARQNASKQSQNQTAKFGLKKLLERKIKNLIRDHVSAILKKLYEQLAFEAAKQDQKSSTACIRIFAKLYPNACKELYPNGCLVGPVGERPLHVCGLLAARYRRDAENQGTLIAEGIFEGMKAFLQDKKWMHEARFPYGRDYCAAVGHFIYESKKSKNESENLTEFDREPGTLPQYKYIWRWFENRSVEKGSKNWQHIKAIVRKGLYQGETLLFPFIASGYENAVKWLLEQYSELENTTRSIEDSQKLRLTSMRAEGLFFRPVFQDWLTSFFVSDGWRWYWHCRGRGKNHYAGSPKTYFGFDILAYAVRCVFLFATMDDLMMTDQIPCSQGNIRIFNMLFKRIGELWINYLEQIGKECEGGGGKCDLTDLLENEELQPCTKTQSGYLASFIRKQTVEKYFDDKVARDDFVRWAVLNRADEFGNTMLHLAAWNSQFDMYDLLIKLGADPSTENKDGLTAFTLTARFGLWDMFKHIWGKHLTKVVWSFGSVTATQVDFPQFETITNGLTSFQSVDEIDVCIEALVRRHISNNLQATSKPPSSDQNLCPMGKELQLKVSRWCEQKLCEFMMKKMTGKKKSFKDKKKSFNDKEPEKSAINSSEHGNRDFNRYHVDSSDPVKNALRLITLFRPCDWYNQTNKLMEEVVLNKWSQGYYLVHIGDSLLPYCVLILIFVLMWMSRKLSVLEHKFWWSAVPIRAPVSIPNQSIEATCGWGAIRDSFSGRLQAVLVMYGVPSLIRLSLVQCRVRPSDLDENVDWRICVDEIINFLYLNLESILHIVIAGLFITIGAARVAAGDQCEIWALEIEKTATSIAALGIFCNLFILCKPYKGFGLLVLTWYRFLLSDVFNFLVMYCMIFVAFLIALQTLHNANYEYLLWMDQSETILPQVQAAIKSVFPGANPSLNLTYLVNSNAPDSNQLLSTEVALDGCLGNRHTLQDTAFSLLEISFGDGLADAVEQARTKNYVCAGFAPDYLVGYLLLFWVFLTNTLIMNMLISMMNHTFDKQMESLSAVWLLDISKRIMRYEDNFSELGPRMQRTVHVHSIFSGKYWLSKFEDLVLILYCFPEIHRIALLFHIFRVIFTKYSMVDVSDMEKHGRIGSESTQSFSEELSWAEVRHTIDSRMPEMQAESSQCNTFCAIRNWLWHPHRKLVHRIHRTSLKAVVFGSRAEAYVRKRAEQQPEAQDQAPVQENVAARPFNFSNPGRLAALVYRLERLKESMSNRKLKVHHDVPEAQNKGLRVGPVGWPTAGSRTFSGAEHGSREAREAADQMLPFPVPTATHPVPTATLMFPFPVRQAGTPPI